MISDAFALPSSSAIERWLQAIDLRPGVCAEVLNMVKNKGQHITEWKKNAVVHKVSLYYDSTRDVI